MLGFLPVVPSNETGEVIFEITPVSEISTVTTLPRLPASL
jgi:hypothetical protein